MSNSVIEGVLAELDLRFTSANDVPVTRARITLEEYQVLKHSAVRPKVEIAEYAEDSVFSTWYKCQTCGNDDILRWFKYCPNCGGEIACTKQNPG